MDSLRLDMWRHDVATAKITHWGILSGATGSQWDKPMLGSYITFWTLVVYHTKRCTMLSYSHGNALEYITSEQIKSILLFHCGSLSFPPQSKTQRFFTNYTQERLGKFFRYSLLFGMNWSLLRHKNSVLSVMGADWCGTNCSYASVIPTFRVECTGWN